jgi:SAM-dependent methyltransferase
MLKMYHPTASDERAGGSPEYWEATWADGALAEALRFCEVDPLRPLFEEFLVPGALVLEGGCGRGQYVAYYAGRGVRMVGLDFATTTLSRLRRSHPDLRLCGGDVGRLPFRSGAFRAYYSGGVVEHFEGGPLDALREARRVLADEGVLLVSVPYQSPLRRLGVLGGHDRRRVAAVGQDGTGEERRFFQYAFSRAEFSALLRQAGFVVARTQGYAILFGLMELPFVGRAIEAAQRRRERRGVATPCPADTDAVPARPASPPPLPRLLKRLLVSEDASVPVLGASVRLLRWAAANMMMYVCTPAGRA